MTLFYTDAGTLKKPPRPLNDYCIYFRMERHRILQKTYNEPPDVPKEYRFDRNDPSYVGPPLPPQYEGVVLPRHFYRLTADGKEGPKRKHRMCHGKITFPELSKRVAASWKIADPETKSFCKQLQKLNEVEHKSNLVEFKEAILLESCRGESKESSENTMLSYNVPFDTTHHGKGKELLSISASLIEMPQKPVEGATGNSKMFLRNSLFSPENNDSAQHRRNRFTPLSYECDGETTELFGMLTPAEKQLCLQKLNSTGDGHQNLSTQRSNIEDHNAPKALPFSNSDFFRRTSLNWTISQKSAPSRFNIFCQLEKAYIVQRELRVSVPDPDAGNQFNAHDEGFGNLLLPCRYRGLFIPARFYEKYHNEELGELMCFKVTMPSGIKCSYDIFDCVGLRWTKEVDDETKEFCDSIHRTLLNNLNKPSVTKHGDNEHHRKDFHRSMICAPPKLGRLNFLGKKHQGHTCSPDDIHEARPTKRLRWLEARVHPLLEGKSSGPYKAMASIGCSESSPAANNLHDVNVIEDDYFSSLQEEERKKISNEIDSSLSALNRRAAEMVARKSLPHALPLDRNSEINVESLRKNKDASFSSSKLRAAESLIGLSHSPS